MAYNPLTIFFKEAKGFKTAVVGEHFDRAVRDFFEMRAEELKFFKEHAEGTSTVNRRPNEHVVGSVPADATQVERRSHEFFGVRSWQPSYAFSLVGIKFNILQFDQSVWNPGLLASSENRHKYAHALAHFCDSLNQLRPSLCVHYKHEDGTPLYITCDQPESLIAFLAYQDDLPFIQKKDVLKNKCLHVLKELQQLHPGEVTKKEWGWILSCIEKDIYSDLIERLKASVETSTANR